MFSLFKRESQQEKADREASAVFSLLSKDIQSARLIENQPNLSSQAVPVNECGISLAWLRKLLALSVSYDDISTEQIVQRVFNPITALKKKCRYVLSHYYVIENILNNRYCQIGSGYLT